MTDGSRETGKQPAKKQTHSHTRDGALCGLRVPTNQANTEQHDSWPLHGHTHICNTHRERERQRESEGKRPNHTGFGKPTSSSSRQETHTRPPSQYHDCFFFHYTHTHTHTYHNSWYKHNPKLQIHSISFHRFFSFFASVTAVCSRQHSRGQSSQQPTQLSAKVHISSCTTPGLSRCPRTSSLDAVRGAYSSRLEIATRLGCVSRSSGPPAPARLRFDMSRLPVAACNGMSGSGCRTSGTPDSS